MKTRTLRIAGVAGAALITSIALLGCTSNLGAPNNNSGSGMTDNNSNSSGFSESDIMFAQVMIPHHQQAVDMGTLAETRALSPEVKALAAKIKAEQAPEIIQMQGWLSDSNSSMGMGHDMGPGMDGMLSDADMKALENASGAAFDKLYLEGMIAHHEGAIQMAQMVIDSSNDEARAIGEAIVSSQTEQIAYMKTLLAN